MTRKRAAYAYHKNLRQASMNTSAGLRHAYATLYLLSRRVVKEGKILVPDPATVHCGQRYDLKTKLPGGEKLWKKIKGDKKKLFWQRKIRPIILNKSGRKWAGQIDREMAAGLYGLLKPFRL